SLRQDFPPEVLRWCAVADVCVSSSKQMNEEAPVAAEIKHYFVDEAGDPTLFDDRGRVIAGTEGCSSHFILGVLSVDDPLRLNERLAALHQTMLADPFFNGVESLKPERKKTALLLHAKDDIPEIRERVFRLLAAEAVRFFAVVDNNKGDIRN